METMEAYAGKMETRLKRWGARLDQLVAKAEEAGAEAKTDTRKHIEDLKANCQIAQSKLVELKAAGSENREIVKVGVERAWKEIEIAFRKLKR